MIQYSKYGDELAFELLLQRYRNQVYGFLIRATGNRFVADDLYQETFFKLIRYAPKYKPKSSFRTFLFTITRNTLNDHYRKQKRNPIIQSNSSQNENPFHDASASQNSNPAILADRIKIRRLIDDALNQLPPKQKEMFLLRQEANLDFKEAARTAHCSVNTAKSRMRYALLKLRDLLQEHGVNPEGSI